MNGAKETETETELKCRVLRKCQCTAALGSVHLDRFAGEKGHVLVSRAALCRSALVNYVVVVVVFGLQDCYSNYLLWQVSHLVKYQQFSWAE